ncbi:unnamed protein product [Rhizophagus irregularis]|nr:unnamed protein product [Rhizophagus irregularis]
MQSEIDSLKEINSKLLAEISELRKENAEVKAENIEVKVENAKLKHALEEHEARFTNLEQRDKEKTNLIAKLDDDIREIKQEQNVNILAQSNTFIPKSPIHSISSQSSISPNIEGISKQSDCSDHSIEKNNADPISQDFDSIPLDQTNISSVVDQYDTTESKSLEDDRETDSFLDEVHRKKVSNEIRERKRKIKLQHELTTQVSSSVTSVSSCPPTSSCSGKNVEKLCLKERDKQNTPSHQKILYREKVERGLRQELSSFCSKDSDGRVFDIQIPEFSLEAILTGSSKITAQTIVELFNVAMKVRHKEILCWYCYYKAYEDRIRDFKSTNKIDDQSARTLVYSEIKSLLPDITDVNLRKITSRAKKFDRNSDPSCFPKTYKSSTDDTDECQKMISVTNRHAHVTESSEVSASMISSVTPQASRTHDRTYFRNKILDQYPNLYRECSSENFDYYGITDETSCGVSRETICPLCKLGHNDEEIEDFGVGEKYKKETGCEPWQLSEDRLLINSKPENKVSYLTSPEQCEEKGPITFEARPDPKLIINRGAHHFPYDPELANIGQKQIMTVQIPRIVQLIKSWKALC